MPFDHSCHRVGSTAPLKVDVRLIAATDANLESAVEQGRFRAPLLHRLAGYEIVKTDAADPDVIRFTVKLQLKDRKGKASDREAVYAVALRSPVAVARDPYF